MIESMYIHIPFCRKICTYCDFCKVLYLNQLSSCYFEALAQEIDDRYMQNDIKTLYIGGGTPSILNQNDLNSLAKIISKIKLASEYEFTFECNISDINDELLLYLKKLRVNRLSIGIESFDSDNLLLMDRECTYQDTLKKISLCRKMGFNNINLDLIYALPNEDLKTLKKDLDLILKLNPEHISTYSLIIEENTMLKVKQYENIAEELDFEMYNYIINKLKNKGYIHYEISNFSKPGFESKHNLNCWNNLEYYGFGLGAAGYFAGVRYENTRSLNKYKSGEYILNNEIVTKQEKMKYELMLGLRKTSGVNIKEFHDKFDVNINEVFDFNSALKNKDLILKNNQLFINSKRLYVMNEILLKII